MLFPLECAIYNIAYFHSEYGDYPCMLNVINRHDREAHLTQNYI